ncbi:hypothetical protein JCM10908_005545 [Rhodotorula pacifica]|uniref:type-X family DNA polymerase n=1 Tax=Rhodotorula pacifica TaxID=1495444 RepID=UPI00316B495A
MASPADEAVFDPEITALLTAPDEPSWLNRLRVLEQNRIKLLEDAAESDNESDPDAITIPLGAKLTWINNSANGITTGQGGRVGRKEGSDDRMQVEDARGQEDASADGDLVESEVDEDEDMIDHSPAQPASEAPTRDRSSPTKRSIRPLDMDGALRASSSPARQSEVVELSSESEIEDSDDGARSAATRQPGPSRTKPKASAKAAFPRPRPVRTRISTATATGTATKGKGGRAKARMSLEQAMENVKKLRGSKLTAQFSTVTELVDHLAQFTSVQPNAKRSLDGCRIVFINTDHWRAANASTTNVVRNPLDEGARLCLTVAAKQGATLVAPEDFVAPDPPSTPRDQLDADQAEAEQWTTHIIPYVLSGQTPPTYDQILACLGPEEGGISRDELGQYVKVVKYDWVAACVDKHAKVQETMYLLSGDFRLEARKPPPLTEQQKRDVKERAQRAKEKAKQDERAREEKKKLKARAGKGAETDSGSDKGSSSGEEENVGVSPLGSQDWPEGEKPPLGYFDRPTPSSIDTSASSEPTVAQNSKQDTNEPARAGEQVGGGLVEPEPVAREAAAPVGGTSRYKSIPGLESEVKFLNTYGEEQMDEVLEEKPTTKALLELDDMFQLSTNCDDDRATDEGTEESDSDDEPAKKKSKPSVWACDDPTGAVAKHDNPNENIARTLEMMADLASSTTDKETFRQRSYKAIAAKVRKMRPIPQEVKHKDLVQVKGIGAKTASKIIEIARTGTHRRIACITPKDKVLRELCGVHGIGMANAEKLFIQGARSVENLRANPEQYDLQDAALQGLQYYDDLRQRIPRAEMTELYEAIKRLSRKIDPHVQIECMGSYRRGALDSGDIDLLVTREVTGSKSKTHAGHIAKLWEEMERAGIAVSLLSQPSSWHGLDAKINGLCRLPNTPDAKVRRIDILGVPWHEMPAALIYFTGDDHFNRSIRLKARKHGYRLNQRGLYENVARDRKGEKLTEGTLVPGIRTERDIFKKLCVPWREPTERNL